MVQRSAANAEALQDNGVLPQVHAVYQPVVDLRTGDVVGYEALARGLPGSPWESPAALFEWARGEDVEAVVDQVCQAAAMSGALTNGLPRTVPLFFNADPAWLGVPWPSEGAAVRDRAQDRLQIVVEITERALINDPDVLLAAVQRIRRAGWGVALDDVGANPASLALMPFIEPDVIKLDLSLVQQHLSPQISMIVNAVIAQAERSGAILLAEGIETEEHRARALAMGATLGQGWLLGRPGPLPQNHLVVRNDLAFVRDAQTFPETPFGLIRGRREVRTATKDLLMPMSHHLERHALRTSEAPVLLATFEDANHFTAETALRYERLARRCAFVGAFGVGMAKVPVPGVHGADLRPGDRLAGEWVVCTVGPHFAGALIAKDLGDTGPDRERRFEMAITYDRDLVLSAARSLLSRISKADDARPRPS